MSIAKYRYAQRFSRKGIRNKVEELYEQEQLRDAIDCPAAKLTLKFGPHKDKDVSLVPPEYKRWLLEHSGNVFPLGCDILQDYMEVA